MATVNEHRKLDGGRTAQIHEGVERGADGATGIEHVVYKHDGFAVKRKRDVRAVHFGGKVGQEVVAIEADVQASQGRLLTFDFGDLVGQTLGQNVAAGDDAHEHNFMRAVVRLQNLVRDARKRSLDLGLIHHDRFHLVGVFHTHSPLFD